MHGILLLFTLLSSCSFIHTQTNSSNTGTDAGAVTGTVSTLPPLYTYNNTDGQLKFTDTAIESTLTSPNNTIYQNIVLLPDQSVTASLFPLEGINPYSQTLNSTQYIYSLFSVSNIGYNIFTLAGVNPYNPLSFYTFFNNITGLEFESIANYIAVPGTRTIESLPYGDTFLETTLINPRLVQLNGRPQVLHIHKSTDNTSRILYDLPYNSEYYVNIVRSDIVSTDGLIHIIDGFVPIPSTFHNTLIRESLYNIIQLLEFTNLLSTVDNYTSTTYFIPNNLGLSSTLQSLSQVSQGSNSSITSLQQQVSDILKQHIIPDVYYSTSLFNQTNVTTITNSTLSITTSNGTVYVGKAQVLYSDLLTSNGVIHIVNTTVV